MRNTLLVGACGLSASWPVSAWVLTINAGSRAIYLQVGTGTSSASNATVNVVSVAVPAAAVGTGTPQTMTSNSAVAQSPYDGFAVCAPPQQVYIGAWQRQPSASGSPAVLTVTTPATLTSGADTIAFTEISWTSTAIGNANADIPAGTFTGSTQALRNIAPNTWVENCLTFSYANAALRPQGVYSGRATYTLVLP